MPRRFSTVSPDEITVVHQGDNQTLCFWVAPVIQDHPPGLNIWFKLKPNNKSIISIDNSCCKTYLFPIFILWHSDNNLALFSIYKIRVRLQVNNFFNMKEHTRKHRCKGEGREGNFPFATSPPLSNSHIHLISCSSLHPVIDLRN